MKLKDKKKWFIRWAIGSFLGFVFVLIVINTLAYLIYPGSVLTHFMNGLAPFLFVFMFLTIFIIFSNLKLPIIEEKKGSLVCFIIILFCTVFTYLFFGQILWRHLLTHINIESKSIDSLPFLTVFLILIYRISLYFDRIPRKAKIFIKEEIDRAKPDMIKEFPFLEKIKYAIPLFFDLRFITNKYRNLLFDFIAITVFVPFLLIMFGYGWGGIVPKILIANSWIAASIALFIEGWVWLGMQQFRFWG